LTGDCANGKGLSGAPGRSGVSGREAVLLRESRRHAGDEQRDHEAGEGRVEHREAGEQAGKDADARADDEPGAAADARNQAGGGVELRVAIATASLRAKRSNPEQSQQVRH